MIGRGGARIGARLALQALLSLVLASLALPSHAATPAPASSSGEVSYSTWSLDGTTVRVRVEVPVDAARKLGVPGAPAPSLARVASAVSQAISISTQGGDCEAIDQGEGVGQIYTLALTPGIDRYEMVFACPQAERLTLKNSLLFDRDAGQIGYARIAVGGKRPQLQTFTRDKPAIVLGPTGPPAVNPVDFARRAAIGWATSLAALGVLLGSALMCRRWTDLAMIVGAIAAGGLVAVALALPGILALDQGLADALAGVLIMALGLGGLLRSEAIGASGPRRLPLAITGLAIIGLAGAAALRAPLAGLASAGVAVFALACVSGAARRPAPDWPAFAPAALFALLQGLGLASDLLPLHPAASEIAPILAAGLAGEVFVATVIPAVAMGVFWLAGRRFGGARNFAFETSGAALIGLGLFWFVSRLHS